MADKKYAVYDKTTKELLSTGTVLGDSLPSNLDKVELSELIGIWNKTTLSFDPLPAPEPNPRDALKAKESDKWTLTDVADFLKTLG